MLLLKMMMAGQMAKQTSSYMILTHDDICDDELAGVCRSTRTDWMTSRLAKYGVSQAHIQR